MRRPGAGWGAALLAVALGAGLAAAEPPAGPPGAGGRVVVPDVVLLDQRGAPVRLYTDLVKGKRVAINFVFTRCTTICPPMGASFSKLQQLLGQRLGKDVRLISISVDPLNDTPERMRAWGEKFKAGPGWTLLTGPREDVDRALKALGGYTSDKWAHAPLVLVGNEPAGTWSRINGFAPLSKLVEVLGGEGAEGGQP